MIIWVTDFYLTVLVALSILLFLILLQLLQGILMMWILRTHFTNWSVTNELRSSATNEAIQSWQEFRQASKRDGLFQQDLGATEKTPIPNGSKTWKSSIPIMDLDTIQHPVVSDMDLPEKSGENIILPDIHHPPLRANDLLERIVSEGLFKLQGLDDDTEVL